MLEKIVGGIVSKLVFGQCELWDWQNSDYAVAVEETKNKIGMVGGSISSLVLISYNFDVQFQQQIQHDFFGYAQMELFRVQNIAWIHVQDSP